MPLRFLACRSSVDRHDGVLIVALGAGPAANDGGDDDAEAPYLMLQKTLAPTAQDASFGMDRPYLEFCGQGWSWYGEIERFELRRGGLVVDMSASAAARMANDGVIVVEFDPAIDDTAFNGLRGALAEILAGHPGFVDLG